MSVQPRRRRSELAGRIVPAILVGAGCVLFLLCLVLISVQGSSALGVVIGLSVVSVGLLVTAAVQLRGR